MDIIVIEILRLWRIESEIADVLLCACKPHNDTEFSKSNGNNRESSKE